MAVPFQNVNDLTGKFNSQYNITQDLAGWDKTCIQVVGPVTGTLFIYGSLDPGSTPYSTGSANTALNFTPIQATNLATGTAVASINAAGLYLVTNNQQFLRLQGNPAATPTNVYRLLMFSQKV